MEIIKILQQHGHEPLDRMETETTVWLQHFKGHVKDFHEYMEYQGAKLGNVKRKRHTLRMAKTIAEIWADNIINPETLFILEDEVKQSWWDAYESKFKVKARMNGLIEQSFALGTGGTVQYKDAKQRAINLYVPNEFIFPLEEANGEIVSCAFVSEYDKETYYIQIHEEVTNGYMITNLFADKETGKKVIVEGIKESVETPVKQFQLYSPAIVNNIDLNNPLGISIYANAIDELMAVDIAFDALIKEVRNGRMRVYVQGEALVLDKGTQQPVFNKDQDEFFLLPEDAKNPDGTLVKVEAPTLRVEALIQNLEKQLNLLGSKCGLGDNAFHSENGTIYTNTSQVVSTNSKFYKTRVKHCTQIESSIIEMIKAIWYVEHSNELTTNVHVEFDDSIIHDKDAEQNRARLEYASGLISAVEYHAITRGYTREEAKTYWEEQLEDMEPDVEDEGGEV